MASLNSFGVPKGVKKLPNGRTPAMFQTHCPICENKLHDHEFVIPAGPGEIRCKHCNVEKSQTWLIGDVEINGATFDIRRKCPCLNDHDLMRTPVDPYDLFDAAPDRLFRDFIERELDADAFAREVHTATTRELQRKAAEVAVNDFIRFMPAFDFAPIVREPRCVIHSSTT